MKWMINCREATGLSLLAEDRPLALGERVRLRMHLMVCKACPRFVAQLRLMRGAMDPWRAYRDGQDDGGPTKR